MEERRETYRGHDIVVRPRLRDRLEESQATPDAAGATPEATTAGPAEPELSIDGEPVVTVPINGDRYIASGFAYAPEPSLVDLAKRMIDVEEAGQEGG